MYAAQSHAKGLPLTTTTTPRMNSMKVPVVHRLSTEILQIIFHLVGDVVWNEFEGYKGAPAHTHLSHVCRRWRAITTDTEDFWSHWPRYDAREAWTMLCCLRAPTVPLSLHWRIGWDNGPASTTEAQSGYTSLIRPTLSHASRARDLTIHIDSHMDETAVNFWQDEVLPTLSLQTFSALRYFFVELDESNQVVRRHDFMIPLEGTLFCGISPPQLRWVWLTACEVTLSCPILSVNLRSLKFSDTRAWDTVDEMIQFFQSIPNLEDFEYRLAGPRWDLCEFDATPSEHHPLRAVPMSRLKSFALDRTRVEPGLTIFNYLALPIDAKIVIQWVEDEEAETPELNAFKYTQMLEHMRSFARALRLHFEPALSSDTYFHSVQIDYMTVSGYADFPPPELEHLDNGTLPSLTLPAPFMESNDFILEPELCEMTALQPVFLQATYLRLAGRTSDWEMLWGNLTAYQQITALELIGENVITFVYRLLLPEYPSQELPPLFPALEAIGISNFDFVAAAAHEPWMGAHLSVHALGDAVDKAYGSSEHFRELYIDESCNGRMDAVARLRSQMRFGRQRVQID